ncbi:glycosyltransferase family 2 protein [Hydrocarboniclastica marina]|uniref:Glycosyltransferase family 2 protein n=1 Tax=Hydrocarboniclastica marina TaxID=2259620 RepID=A0A4P7XGZ4_9ALTE|nr:glycosyltransferase family 2 protein [Hydrocarboniclastica marina]QCF26298.1 glycosyltransferase family 2 protein [Hydrocarboniclastica marina]
MLELLFWISAAVVVYVYLGYPAITALLSLRKHPRRKNRHYQPKVSILIAAYNEEKDIAATLHNKIAQNYPADRLEVLVVSDESTDETDAIVERIAAEAPFPIRLFRQIPRKGKTSGLNMIVPEATGEIIIFSDANSQWAPDAVAQLAANFADTAIGYVTGKMVYTHADGSLIGDGCSAYMKYENQVREWETDMGSVVGVDGGIDAMRKSLYEPLRADQLPDFVQPLKVVEKGYRVVYEPRALLKEPANDDTDSEFSMRVRVSLRAIWALKDMSHLMSIPAYGVFAFQLISHKLLRYYAFVPLALLALVSVILADEGGWYTLGFLAQVAFYAAAWMGYQRRAEGDLPVYLAIPLYFALLNLACFQAALAFRRGEKKVLWNPRKG